MTISVFTIKHWVYISLSCIEIVLKIQTKILRGRQSVSIQPFLPKIFLKNTSLLFNSKFIVNDKTWLGIMKIQSSSNTISVVKQVLTFANSERKTKLNQHSHCSLFALCIDIDISVCICLYVYVHYWTAFHRSLICFIIKKRTLSTKEKRATKCSLEAECSRTLWAIYLYKSMWKQ